MTATLPVLAAMPTTLKQLRLVGSKVNLEAMQVLCSVLLSHCKSMTDLFLDRCKISDKEAQLLAAVLYRLMRLELLFLHNNDIHDSGLAIAEALIGHTALGGVNLEGNPISASGCAALAEFKKTNNTWWLWY